MYFDCKTAKCALLLLLLLLCQQTQQQQLVYCNIDLMASGNLFWRKRKGEFGSKGAREPGMSQDETLLKVDKKYGKYESSQR